MKKLLLLPLFLPFLFLTAAEAQKNNKMDYGNSADAVRKTRKIFYYGVDFSHVRISDGDKISKNEVYTQAYPPAWIAYVEKEMPPGDYVQKSLRKQELYYKQQEIYDVSVKVFHDFIIAPSYRFSVDTVIAALKKYTLSENSGTGLVLIPENFNKKEELAITWIVFFDIGTREILWATKFSGHCSHMGYTAHWGSGVVNGFKAFVNQVY
jgi:hypothetical protein